MTFATLLRVSHRKGSWLVTLPLVGVALTYLTVWFVPTRKAVAKLQVSIFAAEKLIESFGTSVTFLEPVERELVETRNYVENWDARIAAEGCLPAAFAAISDAASAAHVETARFAPKPPQHLETLSRVSIDMQIDGTFAELGDFLGRLERLPLITWVEQVAITTDGKHGGKLHCGLTIVVFADHVAISD